jgi:hypothetical protein
VLGVVLCLVAGACSNDRGGAVGATVPVETTTTVATIDVTKVPDVVTIEYVDAVMDKLDPIIGDAFRELVRDHGPNQKFLALLDAVYDGQEFEAQQSDYGFTAARGFENVRTDPGDPATKVERLIKNVPGCLVVAADREFAAFYVDPKDKIPGFIALIPKSEPSDPAQLNPTAWSIVFDGGTLDNVEPVTAC